MPCPACIVALMGTDSPEPEPTQVSTGTKLALAGAALLAGWLVFRKPARVKRNGRRRRK